MSSLKNSAKVGLPAAAALVIANMIGTGVFTSLGFQLVGLKQPLAVLLLWCVGAFAALCGAMVYGELGAAMPRSGAEYQYLSRIYHPALGFVSGWVSVCIGFPAPIALAAMAFGSYFSAAVPVASPAALAVAAIVVLTAVQSAGIRTGSRFQSLCSCLNVLLILCFAASGLFFSQKNVPVPLGLDRSVLADILSPAFAVSLVYVTYAYSGWNAAAYIAGDMDRPQKNLPLALLAGTALVSLLYLLLNYTFLATATTAELAGKIDIGYISAGNIFGTGGRSIVGCIIAMLLVSSISSFIYVGPRLTQAMGEDYRLLRIFARRTATGVPLAAMLLQSGISLLLIATASFEAVLVYVGFVLNLCTFLAVFGVFLLRKKFPGLPRPYKTWGYPYVPIAFLGIMGWNLVYLLKERPLESAAGLGIMLAGLVLYCVQKKSPPAEIFH